MHVLLATLSASAILAIGSIATIAPPESNRHLTINLTVQDSTGAPIGDAPFCATTSSAEAGGATDPLGKLSVSIAAEAGEPRLALQMQSGCGFRGSWPRFLELISSYAVESIYWIDVPRDGDVLELTIRFEPSVLVTGRVVDENGQPVKATGQVGGLTSLSQWREDGRFTLPVRAGKPSELYFLGEGGVVHLVSMQPLAEDRDLGDVVLSPVHGDATVQIMLEGGDEADTRLEDNRGAATLISADGSRVFCFIAKPPGLIVANYGTGELPAVPEGTYYVTPGLFGNSLSFKVLDAARAGLDLKPAGIPTIVAVKDQEASLVLDIPNAEAAINSVVLSQPGLPPRGR